MVKTLTAKQYQQTQKTRHLVLTHQTDMPSNCTALIAITTDIKQIIQSEHSVFFLWKLKVEIHQRRKN